MAEYRSVSPQAVPELHDDDPRRKSGLEKLSSIFSFSHPDNSKPVFSEKFIDMDTSFTADEPLMNNFSSAKKKRMSLQGHPLSELIPRTSTLHNNFGGVYNAYFNNIQTTREELSNDVERRMSTVYSEGIVKDGPEAPMDTSSTRDGSPIIQDTYREQSLDIEDQILDVGNADLDIEKPYIIEHEFAPLYQDEDGNLVRPPFINIDPRERYQLLQLKKSIEASELLQRRIKYMVDPHETQSLYLTGDPHNAVVPHRKMVETSTQTHDADYLDNRLSFARRKRTTESRAPAAKRQKKGGVFSADFFYDVKKVQPKAKNKLDGYLANVVKPTFKNDNTTPATVKSHDEDSYLDQFGGQNKRSTSSRIGLDDSLLNNTKLNVKLDNLYVMSKDIGIKLKDNTKNAKGVGPSSGFQFNINKSEIQDIIGHKEKERSEIEGLKKEAPKVAFGKTEKLEIPGVQDEKEVPKFVLGTLGDKKESSSISFGALGKLPKASLEEPKKDISFTFGKLKESKEVPKFSFGKLEAPKLAISKAAETTEAPKFSFGKLSESGSAPKSSFGQVKPSTTAAPKVLFGQSVPSDVPELSLGKKAESEFALGGQTDAPKLFGVDTPKFSFGEKPDSSKLSFGKPEEKPEPKPPTFAFGDKKDTTAQAKTTTLESKQAPAFSFGKTENKVDQPKPAFVFGKSDASKPAAPSFGTPAQNGKVDAPTLTLKSSTPFSGTEREETPKFTFGGAVDRKVETPTPLISNKRGVEEDGESAEKKTKPFAFGAGNGGNGFSFGATKETLPPSFAFGKETPKPAFPEKRAEAKNPAFSFAAGAAPLAFQFGTTPTSAPAAATQSPAFAFGSTSAAAPVASTQTPFAFGGTPVATPVALNPGARFKFASGAPFAANPAVTPFATNAAVAPPLGGFSSGSTTPNQFVFGANTNPGFGKPAPAFNANQGFAAPFGQTQGFGSTPNMANTPNMASTNMNGSAGSMNGANQANGMQSTPLFNFTGTVGSREGTPDPASIFGGPSSGNTSFGFQGNAGAPPPARKILQPRRRR